MALVPTKSSRERTAAKPKPTTPASSRRNTANASRIGPPPPQNFSPFAELGVSGIAVFGGRPVTRERDSRVTGPRRWVTYSDMVANISIVAAAVRYFLNIVASAQWNVKPNEAAVQAAKEEAWAAQEVKREKEKRDRLEALAQGNFANANAQAANGNGTPPQFLEKYLHRLRKLDIGDAATVEPYDPMDPTAQSALSSPTEDKSAQAELVAEFIDSVLKDTATPWRRIMRRSAMYRFMGFGLQEWTAKRRDDGRIGLDDIEARPQHTIDRWEVDDRGTVTGAWQVSPQTNEEIFLPRKKLLYLVEDTLTDSPEGLGLFRHLVEPYARLQKYILLEGQGFERDLRGIPIGRVPYGALRAAVKAGSISQSDATALTAAMEDFVKTQARAEDTSLVLDSAPYVVDTDAGKSISGIMQYGLELLTGQSPSFGELNQALDRINMEMARIIGVEHLMLGGGGSANRALSEDKSRNFYLTVNGSLDDIRDGAQQDIVNLICDMNGIPDELKPQVTHSDVSFRSIQEITGSLRDLATAGAVLQPNDPAVNDIRDMLGIQRAPELSPEIVNAMMGMGGEEGTDEEGNPIEGQDPIKAEEGAGEQESITPKEDDDGPKPNGKRPPFGRKPKGTKGGKLPGVL